MPTIPQDYCRHDSQQPLRRLLAEARRLLKSDSVNEFQILRCRVLLLEATELVEAASLPSRRDELSNCLTPREREVAVALSTGQSNNAIAERLFISVNTVRFHVGNILHKLGAKNRSEAAAIVGRWGTSSLHDLSGIPHAPHQKATALTGYEGDC